MTTVLSELGNKWYPLPAETLFTPQRAPDMWFGDELPPTMQEQMNSPTVQQAKFIVQYQLRQQFENAQRHAQAMAEYRRRGRAMTHVGKRTIN